MRAVYLLAGDGGYEFVTVGCVHMETRGKREIRVRGTAKIPVGFLSVGMRMSVRMPNPGSSGIFQKIPAGFRWWGCECLCACPTRLVRYFSEDSGWVSVGGDANVCAHAQPGSSGIFQKIPAGFLLVGMRMSVRMPNPARPVFFHRRGRWTGDAISPYTTISRGERNPRRGGRAEDGEGCGRSFLRQDRLLTLPYKNGPTLIPPPSPLIPTPRASLPS